MNFENQVPEHKQDVQLASKLAAELPGIFNWALAGLREYLVGGLHEPTAIASAVAQYRHEQNPLKDFLIERYVRTDAYEDSKTAGELAKEYNTWAKITRVRQLTPNSVGMALRSLQVQSRSLAGRTVFYGLRSKDAGAGQQFTAW